MEPRYPKLKEIAEKLEGVKYGSRAWLKLMTQLDIVTAQESMSDAPERFEALPSEESHGNGN